MTARHLIGALLCTFLLACESNTKRQSQPAQKLAPLTVSTVERGPLQTLDDESLGDSARITQVIPDGDGEAVAFTFADPMRHIATGLGLIDRAHVHALLVWPDSVTAVWWPALARLAFTSASGFGVHVVVNVEAATVRVTTDTGEASVSRTTVSNGPASAQARERAVAYVDSIHLQLGAPSESSPLHYTVVRLLRAPGDSLVVFYASAGDASGSRFNPAWYVLDTRSGETEPIDRLVGQADAMPAEAAAWDSHEHFFYVKAGTLYEVSFVR